MRRGIVVGVLALLVTAPVARGDVPTQAGSPWPSMRHDSRNTGRSDLPAVYRGDRPWSYRTGKGIFSTPVVGADGTVYVGSGDSWFYAVRPTGRLRWRLKTGNIIDSAAVLGAGGTLTFGSADENLCRMGTRQPRGRRHRNAPPRILWRFRPTKPPVQGQQVNWWEGNADIAPDGTIYAGNTGGYEYAVNSNGTQKWVFGAGNSIWTVPPFGNDGTAYVGSVDAFVYAIDKDGHQVWRTPTIGFVISSPALGNDGTLYIGSFDSNLYALDSKTGAVKWKFATGDHIYSSPALAEDGHGSTTAIYVASTDGNVYALTPSGNLIWRYDTGDVVRSSPVLGRTPDGRGQILYVGAGNGTVFALDAATGRRRWSYDTTSTDPVLRDRNDLNASPALGRSGVYIGSEDGGIDYVPYDYCLHHSDSRCNTNPGQAFADELTRIFPVTSGGSTELGGYERPLPDATSVVGRFVVRRGGQTQDASIQPAPSAKDLVTTNPPVDFSAAVSGDGHFVFVEPDDFLAPNTDYSVRIAAPYTAQGLRVGNLTLGATTGGTVDDTIRFHTASPEGPLPLRTFGNKVTAFRVRRLAVPVPAFVPSVNQIGFDSYELIAAPLEITPPDAHGVGSILLWFVGARQDQNGKWVADPKTTLSFPLAGRYRDDFLLLSGSNLTLTFSFGDVPLQRFDMRAQLGRDMRVRPGASLYAEVVCATVPTYGPLLFTTRLCNQDGKLIASGTFVSQRYTTTARRPRPCRRHRHRRRCSPSVPANVRPRGLRVTGMQLQRPTANQDGSAIASFTLLHGGTYPAAQHVVSILLTDADTGAVVPIDYRKGMSKTADPRGNLTGAKLTIPAGTQMPARVRAYVVTDVFPLHSREL